MTDYREQAIKDVAEAFGVNERVISARLKVAANCECYIDVHTKYAVAQREARLRERAALRKIAEEYVCFCENEAEDDHDSDCALYIARAALEAEQEK